MSFIERHGLWTPAQAGAADDMARIIVERELETVRVAFADQHGLVRGKTIIAAGAVKAMHAGVRMVGTLLLKDTSNRTAFPVFTPGAGFDSREFEGAADLVLVPDPTTFRVLPWDERAGWVLCEAYFTDGRPVPFDTRRMLRQALERLAARGFDFVSGLEVELHVFRLVDPRLDLSDSGWPPAPPDVALLTSGNQLLSEQRYDRMAPVLDILRREVLALGLPLRSVEAEFGPSQCEFVFDTGSGLESADTMIMFRNAVKQIARRHGYHATFMCRPRVPHVMSSGWHLHQSLRDRRSGRNAFAAESRAGSPQSASHHLSATGVHFLGGLLAHARGYAAFATPTINGYRRYHRANSLAPDRVVWGADNRGAMIRVVGAPLDPATRLENRLGEPAANPYLYMASQIYAGLDGLAQGIEPPPSCDAPYTQPAEQLPVSLESALAALRASTVMRAGFGDEVIDYYTRIKEFELARFNEEVSEWEQREYFDLF
jgi:glutamine synthetase